MESIEAEIVKMRAQAASFYHDMEKSFQSQLPSQQRLINYPIGPLRGRNNEQVGPCNPLGSRGYRKSLTSWVLSNVKSPEQIEA